MILKYYFSFITFLVLTISCFAQLEKANGYFELTNYPEAIKYYEKTLKKDPNNAEALRNIAFSHKKLKNYTAAEEYYQKATSLSNNVLASDHLHYGQVLKNNNKPTEAKKQFNLFLEKEPNSFLGKVLLNSIEEITVWEKEEKAFEINLVENINSKYSDFCALVYQDALIFISERQIDFVNEKTNSSTNRPYLSIFYSKKEKNFEKVKEFSNQLSTEYHDGPVSISKDGNTIYFTRSIKGELSKKSINHSKIYQASAKGSKWKDITPMPFNSEDYSVAHPWITEDGKTLFFTSNMPGGFGGMDLYMSSKTGEEWGKPVNLGKEINTALDEVFPYIKDTLFYFASDGHGGYGGLDIYSIIFKNGKALGTPENLKAPINSPADDFGITFQDKDTGYFSSNRPGGIGSDDIYSFKWEGLVEKTAITGVLQYGKLTADNTKIDLLDENDQVIQSTTTDENGNFKFDKLSMDENYLIKIDESDESKLNQAKLYLTNSKGEKVILANKLDKGKFTFKALPYTYYDELELLEEVDESLLTINIYGQVYKKLPGDYSEGMEILILDEEGNVIGKARTDKDGKFIFDKLAPDEVYLFMLEEGNDNFNVILLDENGKVIDAAKKSDGKFKYLRLTSDKTIITLINEIDEVIKIAENENFIISKILYDYDSYEINEPSKKELDKLITILKKNKDIGVELSSHTDDIGSASFNLSLSQKRADAAVEYILSKGIEKKRIIAKGYGKAHPIAPNKLPNGDDNPEGRAKNRRTEFKVIKLK
ncbi:MAG: hypothetical protein CMD31_12555 [Flavobacteriales bacterium]|nr:hypothetical protein [Flavobacteriales bacterium]|tara:strand:- start:38024 stop:40321 length:2298 start_codon:yes stop_codon:yes gene_type:complete